MAQPPSFEKTGNADMVVMHANVSVKFQQWIEKNKEAAAVLMEDPSRFVQTIARGAQELLLVQALEAELLRETSGEWKNQTNEGSSSLQ